MVVLFQIEPDVVAKCRTIGLNKSSCLFRTEKKLTCDVGMIIVVKEDAINIDYSMNSRVPTGGEREKTGKAGRRASNAWDEQDWPFKGFFDQFSFSVPNHRQHFLRLPLGDLNCTVLRSPLQQLIQSIGFHVV